MTLPTTLLAHHAPLSGAGPHYDWLIPLPAERRAPQAELWAVRVGRHWRDWAAMGRLELAALPPHRRRYLTWQGTLTAGRGHVHTAGVGHVTAHLWTDRRIELTLHRPGDEALALTLQQVATSGRWRAVVRPC